jgi:hypothetical protein
MDNPHEELTVSDRLLLKEEYFHLQTTIESFDQRVLTIKAWSVTASMVGLVAAFTQNEPIILLLSGASSIIFWMIEVLWKEFQQSYYHRLYDIEKYYRNEKTDIYALQISTEWLRQYTSLPGRTFIDIALWPHVMLPHILVAIAGFSLWFLNLRFGFLPHHSPS